MSGLQVSATCPPCVPSDWPSTSGTRGHSSYQTGPTTVLRHCLSHSFTDPHEDRVTDPQGRGCGVDKIMAGLLRGFMVSEEFGSLTALAGAILGVGGMPEVTPGSWLVRAWGLAAQACGSTSGALTWLRSHTSVQILPAHSQVCPGRFPEVPTRVASLRKQVWEAVPGPWARICPLSKVLNLRPLPQAPYLSH